MIGAVIAIGCVLVAAGLGFFGWLTVQLIEIKVGLAEVRVAVKDTVDGLRQRLGRVERHLGLDEDVDAHGR